MGKRKKTKAKAAIPGPPAAAPAPPPRAASNPKWAMVFAMVGPLSLGLFYIYLLAHSWLRWMEPFQDAPRDLYLAWRMSEGDLLYQQLAIWYGPLATLVQGGAFRLFGVGIDTIIWTNIALTAAVIFLLWDIFRRLGNRWSGWLAAVVFMGVFAFGQYADLPNYNFIQPYAVHATYCFAGLVLLLWGLVRHLQSERLQWLGVAGLGLAVAYLDKPEGLLAALGALGIYLMARMLRAARSHPPATDWGAGWRWLGMGFAWVAGGFACLWLPVFLYFLIRGGFSYAVLATDFVPYSVLSSHFRNATMGAQAQQHFLGFDNPGTRFVWQTLAGVGLVAVCGVMAWAAREWTRAPKSGTRQWAWPVVVAAAAGAGLWVAQNYGANWLGIGTAINFPVIIGAVVTAGWSLRAAWMGGGDWQRPLGLAVMGVAAALMLARMILFGRIFHFGFFMMPLAALWLVHIMVVEAARPAPGRLRSNLLLSAVFSALVLAGVGMLAMINLANFAAEQYQVGAGRDHFYAYTPVETNDGLILQMIETQIKESVPQAKTVTVFPEGIMVNYLLRMRSPLAEVEFQPTDLAFAGPAHVLDELQAHPPDCIVLYGRDLSEFGVPYFGANEASGRDLVRWINAHYTLIGKAGATNKTISHHLIDILVRGEPTSSGNSLLQDVTDIP